MRHLLRSSDEGSAVPQKAVAIAIIHQGLGKLTVNVLPWPG